MRNSKNALISILCVIILMFNTTINAFAVNITNDGDEKSNNIVYLTAGQGDESAGDGSQNNPYLNIKTALKKVNPGGTIKILGQFNYWKYEEHSTLLPRPLTIDKEVTIEGVDNTSVFITRAPIQLAADVTFKNIRMEFWASNEVMPGVPDSGLPGEPVDTGTEFRSGRSIYLAGHTLTLDNIDTRVNTISHQGDYRPYISGGTFLDQGSNIGSKAVLKVINPNEGTQFAGIYAGDYWTERNYPVELNIRGEVLDRTVHTGGITKPFNGDVVINIYSKTKVSTIDNNNHNGNYDVNVKENVTIQDAIFTGIRNLTLESGAQVNLKNSSDFTLDDLTINKDALLDLTNITGDIKVNGNFIGYDNTSDDPLDGGAIFLHDNQTLDISGDVKGNTRLNSYNNINKVPLKENHTYIKAKENALGDFVIDPEYSQSDYKLEKNTNNSQRTTWTAIREKNIFKDFRWTDNLNDTVIDPENTQEAIYNIEYINEKDEVYMPFGDDWDDFSATLEKPDGTILDTNGDDWDLDLGIYLYENEVIIDIYNTSFSGEVILTVKHSSGKFITRKIQIGEKKGSNPPEIHGADNRTINVGDVDKFNEDLLAGITVTDDKDTIDPKSIKVTGQVDKPNPGSDGTYKITYEVTDNDKNTTIVDRIITVTNRLPEIFANDITIKAGKAINLLTDTRIGLDATDHEDGNKKSSITVKSTGGFNSSNPSEGTYKIIYQVKDSDSNTAEKEIKITVLSNNAPVINGAGNITIKVGQVDKFDLLSGVTVTDDHDKNLSVTVSGKINKPSAGTNLNSKITYTVKDNDGNITTATRVITVTNQLPTIEGLSNITIKRGQTVDLKTGVSAKDNEDGVLTNKIVFPTVNLSTLSVGKHQITYKVTDSDNNTVTKTRIVNVEANTIVKTDLIGSNRYGTAVKISQEGWKSAKTIILVNGLNNHLVDGLTATPLATALDAPILLATNSSVPKATVDEIKRLNPSKIIVIGGTTAINESVISQIKNINKNITVNRISGKTRYETSLNIAKELNSIVPITKIYVGAGNGEADSLSISSVAGREKSPIILTAKNSLDTNTYNYLKSKNLSDAYFIGGTSVISDNVIKQVNAIVSKNVLGNRISGANRRETNANVIKKFYPETTLSGVVIAKDLDLVDALAVGPLAAKKGIPVVLAQNSLSSGQETVLKSKISSKLYQAGGGVNSSVITNLRKLLTT